MSIIGTTNILILSGTLLISFDVLAVKYVYEIEVLLFLLYTDGCSMLSPFLVGWKI